MSNTRFIDPAAVEAWDTWFRWRAAGSLRDLTIDDTWRRVANAFAAREGAESALWARRFSDAFSQWQLLPDERLLCNAGTDRPVPYSGFVGATLNVAAFVRGSPGKKAQFDRDEFARIAALAVRMLDNACAMADAQPGQSIEPRVGLVGMADALRNLGVNYTDASALHQAGDTAQALHIGCVEANLKLARERGAAVIDRQRLVRRWRARRVDVAIERDLLRNGVRHALLTAIDMQPRVAKLANNVSDALDPKWAPAEYARSADANASGPGTSSVRPDRHELAAAQLRLRGSMQPWIDRPIDYPLLSFGPPTTEMQAQCDALARAYGLKTPSWRISS